MDSPLVSIVLTIYNGSKYLEECLQSILSQTHKNWELIIINDGSTDDSGEIITQFVSKIDNEFKYINLNQNMGIAYCSNLGIKQARGKYIAKMDADDIMIDTRLAEQVCFFENRQDIDIVGSNAFEIDEFGNEIRFTDVPLDNLFVKKQLISTYPIIHPSVMFRSEVFMQGIEYRDLYPRAEDIDLWLRLSHFNFANLKNPLIKKRIHSKQITTSKWGHYDILKLKFDFFFENKIFLKNFHHLLKHTFIVVFIPNVIYVLIKKSLSQRRKK